MHTHIYVWGFSSVRLFPLISINGLDLPSFISTFFSSPEAFDIQPMDIKNSGLNFSPSLFASVAVEQSLNTGVQIWYDMQTQLQKTWVPFQINFFFRDDLETINSPALRLYHYIPLHSEINTLNDVQHTEQFTRLCIKFDNELQCNVGKDSNQSVLTVSVLLQKHSSRM